MQSHKAKSSTAAAAGEGSSFARASITSGQRLSPLKGTDSMRSSMPEVTRSPGNSMNKKAIPAFMLAPDATMPSPGDMKWSMDRLSTLMQWPQYRPLREKSVMLPPHMRSNSPMTM